MKDLRKHFYPKLVRFFHCGEYGDDTSRPHYHSCLFGIEFEDQYIWRYQNEKPIYRSETLESIWRKGICTVSPLNWKTAAYTARYIMKKINGPDALHHYVDQDTGACLKPEYITMSLKPGLGSSWFDKYHTDLYPSDEVILNGKRYPVPRYYDKKLELINPDLLVKMKAKRLAFALEHSKDQTPDRLQVRKTCKEKQLTHLHRPLHAP